MDSNNEKIRLLKKRDIGEILNASFGLAKQEFKNYHSYLLKIFLPLFLILTILEAGIHYYSSFNDEINFINIIFFLIVCYSAQLFFFAYLRSYYQNFLESKTELWKIFRKKALRYFISLIVLAAIYLGTYILLLVLITDLSNHLLLGFLVLFFLFLFIILFLSHSAIYIPAIFFDDKGFSALIKNIKYYRSHFWKIFSSLSVFFLIVVIWIGFAYIPLTLLTIFQIQQPELFMLIIKIIWNFIGVVAFSFIAFISTFIYFDVKERDELTTLYQKIENIV